MKHIELTIPGRPVPWARPRAQVTKTIMMFTAKKQAEHRKSVAELIAAKYSGDKFKDSCMLQALFIYSKSEPQTWFRLIEVESMMNLVFKFPIDVGTGGASPFPFSEEYHVGRPDLDNLVKQLMEAIEDSGVLAGEDGQISMVMAAKVKR